MTIYVAYAKRITLQGIIFAQLIIVPISIIAYVLTAGFWVMFIALYVAMIYVSAQRLAQCPAKHRAQRPVNHPAECLEERKPSPLLQFAHQ